jgi:glycosyltransferase involved in cell wall biosynthesis
MKEPSTTQSATGRHACEVVCVCGGYGFPVGIASTDRVRLLGKSFLSRGIPFRLLHCGPSPNDRNKQLRGVYEGIRFEYTTGTLHRPTNKLLRTIVYLYGYAVLTLRLVQMRLRRSPQTVVYLFFLGDMTQVYIGCVCRLLGIPLIQDVCEWWPGSPGRSGFTDWVYRRFLPWSSAAAVAISVAIETRLQQISSGIRNPFRVVRIPVLLDSDQVALFSASDRKQGPYVLWVGSVDAYPRDVEFLIQAVASVNRGGTECRLICAGFASDKAKARAIRAADAAGLGSSGITITGFVADETLRELCASASALMLPMWEDDRSVTRYPHKIGDYLMAGRPVITCAVGELVGLLEQDVSGAFYQAGNVAGCADRIRQLLSEPERGKAIGAAGRDVARAKLDYRAYTRPLESLVYEVAGRV